MFTVSLPEASNRADWSEIFEIYDDETGDQVDLSEAVVAFELRANGNNVSATTTIVDIGKFEATFSRDQMSALCAGTYEVGCTIALNGIKTQEFIGKLPVLDGVVR